MKLHQVCGHIFDQGLEFAVSLNYNLHRDIWAEAMSVLQSLTKAEA